MAQRPADSLINRLSLRAKINLAVGGIFTALLVLVTTYEVLHEQARMMGVADYEVKQLGAAYFDSLNIMMLTETMNQRGLLAEKLKRRAMVVDARVIRGPAVNAQYGPGLPEEAPQDELDLRALQGEEINEVVRRDGKDLLISIVPYRATEDTLGVNCLQCHEVPSGTVNGAVRVVYSLDHVEAAVARQFWLILSVNFGFFAVGLLIINMLLKGWVISPLRELNAAVQQRAGGDTRVRAEVRAEDEVGAVAQAFNTMADNVNAITEREHEAAETLRRQIDHLLAAVNRVAEGDYSARIDLGAESEGAIAELAESLQIMITYIDNSTQAKKEEVETLQRKVDDILQVVTLAAEGDLTGEVHVSGDDAIGRLAQGVRTMIDNLNTLVAQVQRSGIQVTSSATEIAATAKQQEATISEQAATTTEIAATATEISATSQELVDTMDEVAEVAERTTHSAASGQQELGNMESTMQQIVEAAGSIAAKFEVLNEKARNINSVVTTITKVADQTNLLSLNAAIEAEKAGEYGLGFAVVANEVRRLADQTAVATLDIEQMVKEMQSAVSSGVLSMEKFSVQVKRSAEDVSQVSAQLTQIINEVRTLTPRFETVQQGMHFQAQGADQIKTAMMQLSDSAQQVVLSISHSNAAIDQLNDAAQVLQSGVSRLRVKRG